MSITTYTELKTAVENWLDHTLFTAVPTAANDVNEDDIISFTPSGATGSATGAFFAVIRRA